MTAASGTGGKQAPGTSSGTGGGGGAGASATSGKGGTTATGKGGATATSAGAGGAKGTGGTMATAGTSGSGGVTGTGGASGSGGISYTADFKIAESPISEGGVWHHEGLDWTVVETAGSIARGTQALGVSRSGPGQYNDSYAYLSGFPPDQQASAVIHMGTIDGSCTHEVEILLRWADSAHDARGYECNVAFDGSYTQIVRWNGAVGDFTYLGSGTVPGGVHDGDMISASIVGDQIAISINGVMRASAKDSTFTTGNPGMGFWRGSSGCGSLGDFGFARYSAMAAAH